jgi:hypothetical protein
VPESQNLETFSANLGRQQTPMSNSSEFPQTSVQENEEFKFIKRFTVFKTVHHFLKIKEAFSANLKIISADHHHQ